MPIFSPDRHACAPSYVKLTKQPITGGEYRPLANDEDSNTCAPSALSGHHGSKLYTQKSAIHAISDNASVFIPKIDAPHLPKTTDDKSIDEAINEAANNSTHSVPPSTEIQLTQANEHPLMQAIEACKQSVHTTAKALSTAGHAVAKAAKTTGHAIHTAATAVKTAWQTFTNFKAIQLIIKFFQRTHALWKKRMRFSYAFYAIVFTLLTSAEVIFLQWGMYTEPTYDKSDEVDQTTKILNSVAGQVTKFVSQMWLEQKSLFLVNFVGLGLIYLALIFVTNRFWIATLLFGTAITAFGVANSIKIQLRNEPIIPADFTFISGGDAGNIASFIPDNSQQFVENAVTVVIWIIAICLLLFLLDRRKCFIYCSWRKPFASAKNTVGTFSRALAAVVSVVILASYATNLGTGGSWSNMWAAKQGYTPTLFDAAEDARNNGPATTFLSLTKAPTMDKPECYSKQKMQAISKKYSKLANSINKSRTQQLTDSTVIMILSETFADPTRLPDITFDEDPIPNIRNIMGTTTSGTMLSPGYGGGTANIEYQALTGLSLASFSDSMIVPYQQLVPTQSNPYSFNQIWTQKYGESGSEAVHPYYQSMYLRNTNYKKFGFSHLYSLDSATPVEHTEKIGESPYVSDSSTYQDVLDLIKNQKNPEFLQVVTMQNHMPYSNYYEAEDVLQSSVTDDTPDDEHSAINVFSTGLKYTDQATLDFLSQLNQINKPITVIFYGDHLPGIYLKEEQNPDDSFLLHETDYFIWSNDASPSANVKLDDSEAAFSSSNYFMSSAAEHMNAKISPYLALLTKLHKEIPAISRVISNRGGIGLGTATYLQSDGTVIDSASMSKTQKQLLADYKLVQYDQTSGKNYLKESDFMSVD